MPLPAYLQHRLLFRPATLSAAHQFQFEAPFEEHIIETPDHVRINALFFPAQVRKSKGVVLYFHGNRGHLQRWGSEHATFTTQGYDFFVWDYRGYGKTPGELTAKNLYEDAFLVLEHLSHGYAAEQIVLYGRSLGSAPATRLAAEDGASTLVLETPFDNIRNLLLSHVPIPNLSIEPAFELPNDEHLRRTQLPVLIFHGTRDRVVPYQSAARLKPLLKPGDRFVTIEGGAHNNLKMYSDYQETLRVWLNR